MKPSPHILRASEINSFLYCRRAWWYQRQNIPPLNRAELESGLQIHSTHSRTVRSAIRLKSVGAALFFLATLLLIFSIFFRF